MQERGKASFYTATRLLLKPKLHYYVVGAIDL